MAVTQIRKVSSYSLLAMMFVSVAIILLFFLGGTEMVTTESGAEYSSFVYTDALLYWSYALFVLTLLATLFFSAYSTVVNRSDRDPLSKLSGGVAFIILVVALVLSYVLGDATPIEGLNADAQKFNTPGWLVTTDMWLYSSYVLLALSSLAALWGAISKGLLKR